MIIGVGNLSNGLRPFQRVITVSKRVKSSPALAPLPPPVPVPCNGISRAVPSGATPFAGTSTGVLLASAATAAPQAHRRRRQTGFHGLLPRPAKNRTHRHQAIAFVCFHNCSYLSQLAGSSLHVATRLLQPFLCKRPGPFQHKLEHNCDGPTPTIQNKQNPCRLYNSLIVSRPSHAQPIRNQTIPQLPISAIADNQIPGFLPISVMKTDTSSPNSPQPSRTQPLKHNSQCVIQSDNFVLSQGAPSPPMPPPFSIYHLSFSL